MYMCVCKLSSWFGTLSSYYGSCSMVVHTLLLYTLYSVACTLMVPFQQTLRTDKEKESARHDEEVQELVDKHSTEQMEIGEAA